MRTKSLIYIAIKGGAVFESQVLQFLKELISFDYFDRVVLMVGLTKSQDWNKELSSLITTKIEVILFKKYPNYSFYQSRQKKELLFLLKRILTDNTILHLRGESLTNVVVQIKNDLNITNVKVITDFRGNAIDEFITYVDYSYNPIKYLLKLQCLNRNLKKSISSNIISFVSESLLKSVLEKIKFNRESAFVNHCIAGSDFIFTPSIRAEYRKKLHLCDTDILFVFVTGGNGPYENTTYILNSIIGKGYKILNLSNKSIVHEDIINLYVPYHEVPKYLCASDIGLIWRENNITNNVASPIKFSEYVCCGLPVLANNGVHLIVEYIEKTGFGIILNDLSLINHKVVEELLVIDREEISRYARVNFASYAIINNFIKIYGRLLNNDIK